MKLVSRIALGLSLCGVAAAAQEWTAYGGDPLGSRFSTLAQIDRKNVSGLAPAWQFRTGEAGLPVMKGKRKIGFEATPLVVDGSLYFSSPLGRVFSLDPATGLERWRFDAAVDSSGDFGDFNSRGVSTWLDPRAPRGATCARRIFVATIDGRLIALDAVSGKPCVDFGQAGVVDLLHGLRNGADWYGEYEVTSPPAVVNGVVVVGSAVADNNRTQAASGEVRAYDARTGERRWTFDPVPQRPGEPGYATWIGRDAHRTGAANAWSVLAADPARDLVIVPTGAASPDYYGGERLGQNLYANSVVALRASTGAVVWSFQAVHHDLWDYDLASPPALVDVERGGRRIAAVLQATKSGQLFVLDRETGAPIFPVEERRVPPSHVPGEQASPTQPFSSLPELSPSRFGPGDAWGLTPEDQTACRKLLSELRFEGTFTPPSLEGSLLAPSNIGGAHWGGLAFDPVRQIVVVPVNRLAAFARLIPRERVREQGGATGSRTGIEFAPMHGTPYAVARGILVSPHGLPCTPPPWGALVAISLRTGRKLWEVPLGAPRPQGAGGEALAAMKVSGAPNLGGPIATAGGLVFIAATMFDDHLRAFDIETGAELWSAALPAGGKATPMTWSTGGRQYVGLVAGGDGENFTRGDFLVSFALGQRPAQ